LTVEIRPLRTEEELELAIRLEASCYPPAAAASPEAFRYRWERFPSYFLSAWDGPQLTGIANGVLTNARDCSDVGLKKTHGGTPDGERLCILTVAVAAERRGRGIGAALLRALIDAAASGGRRGVMLMCQRPLIGWYRQAGFRETGAVYDEHGGIRWHEMVLPLAQPR